MRGRRVMRWLRRFAVMGAVGVGVSGAVMYISAPAAARRMPAAEAAVPEGVIAAPPAPGAPAAPWDSWSFDERSGADRDLADPAVLHAEGEFHVYATSTPQAWVPHFTGPSLARPGGLQGDAMPERPAWVATDDRAIWAPAVTTVSERYALYFAATAGRSSGHAGLKCLGVALASTPAGPFVPEPEPLRCTRRYWSIDPYPVDDGGRRYLLWREDDGAHPTGRIVGAPLTGDGLRLADGPRTLLVGEQPWEDGYPATAAAALRARTGSTRAPGLHTRSGATSSAGIGPIENPAMAQHPTTGAWLLTWSAHRWETPQYATGLAVCDAPLGPCRRMSQAVPWLQTSESDAVAGTSARFVGAGGLSFTTAPGGDLYAVFHAYRPTATPGGPTAPRVGWAYRVEAGPDGSYRLTEFR